MNPILPSQPPTHANLPREDIILRAARVYSMDDNHTTYHSIAIWDGRISAVSSDTHGLDHLASAEARLVDVSELTLQPASGFTILGGRVVYNQQKVL